MKEHPCYPMIMELNLDTLVPVPLNQQPEHGYHTLWTHSAILVALWAEAFTFVWSVYFGWHGETALPCLEMHMANTLNYFFFLFFFGYETLQGCHFPFGVLEVDVNETAGLWHC